MKFFHRMRNRLTASDLRAAADLIEMNGWTQGKYFNPSRGSKGGYCVLGAINSITCGSASGPFSSSRTDRALDALSDLLSPKGTLPIYVIAEWNDLPTQTSEMVTATLRAAAEKVFKG